MSPSLPKAWWKVRAWDVDGAASAYSEPTTFEMGLLNAGDWEGEWIGADRSISAPLLRREFEIAGKVKRARAYISGVGWYELYLNGQKVGDHVLDPATTDYARRVLYVTYDVTELLREGTNAVGVMLNMLRLRCSGRDRLVPVHPRPRVPHRGFRPARRCECRHAVEWATHLGLESRPPA